MCFTDGGSSRYGCSFFLEETFFKIYFFLRTGRLGERVSEWEWILSREVRERGFARRGKFIMDITAIKHS